MKLQVEIPERMIFKIIHIYGVDYYTELAAIGKIDNEISLSLKLEPENKFDNNAVRVYCHGGIPIGYLIRQDAASFSKIMPVIDYLVSMNKIRVEARFVNHKERKKTIENQFYREIVVDVKKR